MLECQLGSCFPIIFQRKIHKSGSQARKYREMQSGSRIQKNETRWKQTPHPPCPASPFVDLQICKTNDAFSSARLTRLGRKSELAACFPLALVIGPFRVSYIGCCCCHSACLDPDHVWGLLRWTVATFQQPGNQSVFPVSRFNQRSSP